MVQPIRTKFFLGFSLPVKPYLEVSTFLLAFSKEYPIELKSQVKPFSSPSGLDIGVLDNPFLPSVKLTVDGDGPGIGRSRCKQYLWDKYAISRYFARSGYSSGKNANSESLFGGLSLASLAIVDGWISKCAAIHPALAIPDALKDTNEFVVDGKALLTLAKGVDESLQASKTEFLLKESGGSPSLADLAVWDVFENHVELLNGDEYKSLPLFQRWFKTLQQHPACACTLQYVEAAYSTVPVLKCAKMDIASQVAASCGVDRLTVYQLIVKPRDSSHGDLAIPVPRLRLSGDPVQHTKNLASAIKESYYVAGAKATGAFLNFSLKKSIIAAKVLEQIDEQGQNYGSNSDGLGKVGIVDYSSPNIAKPFHAGHLRSTIIGNFTRHLLKLNGWRAVGINYLGDWGKQYGLLGIGYAKYGSDEELDKDPIKHLYDVYVKINADAGNDESIHEEARAYFAKLEAGDESALKLWRRFRDMSVKKYKEIYDRINVEFDVYSGESQFASDMSYVIQQLKDCNLLEESEGAQVVHLEKFKCGTGLIAKKDGTTLYLTRDIAALLWRKKEYDFDAAYYVVGTQQSLHFQQLFKTVELMGHPWARTAHHVNFGMIKSSSGDSMSTRKGTVIFLQDIIDHTKEEMHDVMKRNEVKYAQIENPDYVADQVAMSAIIVQDMSARRILNYSFDWNRMLSFEGDTGPYLQYAHARLASVSRTAEDMGLTGVTAKDVDFTLLHEPVAIELAMALAEWPDVIREALKIVEPNNVVAYLFRICHIVASAWDVLWVKGQPVEVAKARLLLYQSAKKVVASGFGLLGLRPLERM